MNSSALLAATAGLIAFHIGLFTLVGRERKSPYVINAVFQIFLICLVVATLAVLSPLIPALKDQLSLAATWAFFLALVVSLATVSRMAIRFIYFVDSVNPKHLGFVRSVRRRLTRKNVTYEHSSVAVPPTLRTKVLAATEEMAGQSVAFRENVDPASMAVSVKHQGQSNVLLLELAFEFLATGFSVQYLSASRHPLELVRQLKDRIEKGGLDWVDARQRVVVIDAYTPHFAFTDSWAPKKTAELESWGITYVLAAMTYAGIHSAAARAFNKIKAQVGKEGPRKPTLVIYEDTSALADLESREQYRIFVRHVMPSERMWGGMFTVFIECNPSSEDWNLLQAGASLAIDISKPVEEARKTVQSATLERKAKVPSGE